MRDGNVVLAGPGGSTGYGDHAILDTKTFTWTDTPVADKFRTGGSAVLQPSGPDGPTKLTQIGGYDPTQGGGFDAPATATSETLDISSSSAAETLGWSNDTHSLNFGRSYGNTVLLPDGSMVYVGGGDMFDGGTNGDGHLGPRSVDAGARRQVELRDPGPTGQWHLGDAQTEDRSYHSTALLLPDGRVASSGDDIHPDAASDSIEVYSPPYLFDDNSAAPRPTLSAVPAEIHPGETIDVSSPTDSPDPLPKRVVMMAPSAVTHASDMSQRELELTTLSKTPGQGLRALAPVSTAAAPPGYYMLFLLDDNGTPSEARWVRFGPRPPDVLPTTENPSGPDVVGPTGTPAPTPTGPARDKEAPKVAGGLELGDVSRGRLDVRLTSQEDASYGLSADLTQAASPAAAKPAVIGTARGTLEAGKRTTVRVKLRRSAMRKLKKGGTVRAVVKVRDKAGNTSTTMLRRKLRRR